MRKTVLIAEDEPSLRSALEMYLTRRGVDVLTACDGEEALAVLDRVRPDLVLLDLLMPKIDGLEVLRRLREKYPDLPVIINTNLSKGFEPEKWAQLGATDIVIKSQTSLKSLAEKVRGYLSR